MQAIILAAGMGKRLKELTSNNTKCMVSLLSNHEHRGGKKLLIACSDSLIKSTCREL